MQITKRQEVTKQGFCKILWRKIRPRGRGGAQNDFIFIFDFSLFCFFKKLKLFDFCFAICRGFSFYSLYFSIFDANTHRFYTKNTTVWVVEYDEFEAFLKCLLQKIPEHIAYSWETKGDWGNTCKHISRNKKSTLTDHRSFQDFYLQSLPIKKHFFCFFCLYKCRKSISILQCRLTGES